MRVSSRKDTMNIFHLPITSAAEAKAYLKTLADDQHYCYHLDDSPFEIGGFSEEEAQGLMDQFDKVQKFLTYEEVWEIYGEAVGV